MRPVLLDVLACPACAAAPLSVTATVAEGDDVREGTLDCAACDRAFPIRDGVPSCLIGQESAEVREAFTQQWTLRYAGAFERPDRVFWLGVDDSIAHLTRTVFPDLRPGSWVLDAGCGSGEKAIALARRAPQVQVVAMDFSDTAFSLAERARDIPNLHVVHGDVSHPPFRPAAFETVISIGVLHHTPDTLTAFRAVERLVAAPGRLLLWLYLHPEDSPLFQKVYYWIRDLVFFGRGHTLTPATRLLLLRALCLPTFAALPVFWLSPARVKAMYQGLTVSDLYRGLVFMLYDDLAPDFQHRHRRAEIAGWLSDAGFTDAEEPMLGLFTARRPTQVS